jgi:hypothetical protein
LYISNRIYINVAISFCGCSVTSINSKLGWNENKSTLEVGVVEDYIRNGDFFNPPALGTPCYFSFGPNYYFWGLLSSWNKRNTRQGLNLYSITVEDPREVLAGTKIILGNYAGTIFGVHNIINAFGYWENLLGFGGADANQGGMTWDKIATAIQSLTNTPAQGDMGGPLVFRGVTYAVDLSAIPVPPQYYRVNGPTVSLLDMIQTVCSDCGCDFFVQLEPGLLVPIIKIYVASRYTQPPLGTISAIANTNWGGTVVESNNGLSLRNEPTTNFLIGGNTNSLYETDAIQPFWGYDASGLPIENLIVNIPGLGYTNAAYINAAEVVDCFNNGAQYYFVTEFELRAALSGRETWESYILTESALLNNKTTTIGPLGIRTGLVKPTNPNAVVLADYINKLHNTGVGFDAQLDKQQILYDFVKRIADTWYGRKYWVQLPFMAASVDPTNFTIHNSMDVSDGGWADDNNTLLGLYNYNWLKFMTDDSRFEAMAVYSPIGINLEEANPQNSVWQNNGFITKISVDKSIYTWPDTGIPNVVITVETPVKQNTADTHGDLGMLGMIFQQDGNNVWRAMQANKAWGTAMVLADAPRFSPLAVAIPLKSNIDTYGPWYYAGPPGKVNVDFMPDLTPWNYGSADLMNLAAVSRVTAAVTFMQISEAGSITLVGAPLVPLGRQLLAGGPDITNIEVRYGKDGIVTTYQFTRYVLTNLNKYVTSITDKIQRLGRVQNEIRKAALLAMSQAALATSTLGLTKTSKLKRFPKWDVSWSSPSPVFIGSSILDDSGAVRTSVAICDPTEGWSGIGAGRQSKNDLFINSALCSISAIVRPFAVNQNAASPYLPSITVVDPVAKFTGDILNPFSPESSDLEYLSAGVSVADENAGYLVKKGIDWNNVRAVGHSMPMIGIGWGYNISGQPSPSLPAGATSYVPFYNVGPLDVLWDMNRGTWSVHDSMLGTLDGDILANNTQNMTISGSQNKKMVVWNPWKTPVVGGTLVCANYQPYLNKWAIIAADCTT